MRAGQVFSEDDYLKALYENECRQMRFGARTRSEAEAWQAELRAKLVEVFGGFPERCPLEARIVDEKDCGSFVQQTVHYQSEPNAAVSAYFLLPKGIKHPSRALICQHGHGFGKDDVMGYDRGQQERRDWIDQGNYAYARYFVERGYVVIAPEARCFGQRRDGPDVLLPDCYYPMLKSVLLGRPLNGQRTWDLIRTLDYLATREEVDDDRIGMVGLSLGAQLTTYLAGLDERVKVVCISGFLTYIRDALLSERHCNCVYDPGLVKYAESVDLAGLIAPRPILIEAGARDPGFPVASAREAVEELRGIYAVFGAEDAVDVDVFDGGHSFSGRKAFDWFDRWL